jgi:hypothetical protein
MGRHRAWLQAQLDGRLTIKSVRSLHGGGTSTWPAEPSRELLLAAGAAIAQVHTVAIEAQPQLPFRPRPIAVDDFAHDRRIGRMPTTSLLERADGRIQAIKPPAAPARAVQPHATRRRDDFLRSALAQL